MPRIGFTINMNHQEKTFVASKSYPPELARREVKNLAFDTLPLEEVVKAFKDNKDSRGKGFRSKAER